MRSRFLSCLAFSVLLLLTAAPVASATVRFVNPDGLCGTSVPCYTNLQDAITSSVNGDVIQVQPGLYVLAAPVDVVVEVTILGPQANVNPLPSRGSLRVPGDTSTEAVFDGLGLVAPMVRIVSSNVEINGLEFRNGSGDMVVSEVGTPTSDVILRNNIIHDSSGDEGVQLRAVAGAVVECNHVYATAGDGINLCCGSTDGSIRFNEVHDIQSPDAAIYVYDATGTTIEGNLVYVTTSNDGIKLGSKNGDDAAKSGGTILNNTVQNTAQDGIAVYMSSTTVRCNEVSGSTSENGGIYAAWGISDVAILDNEVHDNSFNTGKWGDPAGIMIGTGVNLTTVTVTNNRIENNSPNGITNKAAGILAATNNWWGDSSGPSGAGSGTGDAVSTNVDYSAWLFTAPSPSCPPIGECGEGSIPVEAVSWGRIKSRYR